MALANVGTTILKLTMRIKSAQIHLSFTVWISFLLLARLSVWCEFTSKHLAGLKCPSLLLSHTPDPIEPAAAIVVGLGPVRQVTIPFGVAYSPRSATAVLPTRRNIMFLLLLRAGDVEVHPGPGNAEVFPCGICELAVNWSHQAICCDGCDIWFHRSCKSMTESHYNLLGGSTWECCRCHSHLSNTFHSYELHD